RRLHLGVHQLVGQDAGGSAAGPGDDDRGWRERAVVESDLRAGEAEVVRKGRPLGRAEHHLARCGMTEEDQWRRAHGPEYATQVLRSQLARAPELAQLPGIEALLGVHVVTESRHGRAL